MVGNTSIKYLQNYIKAKDYHPELKKDYFLKLTEEIGELSIAIRKNLIQDIDNSIKGTIDEELWDVMYYVIALANCYNIDLENVIKQKEAINNVKYNTGISFETNK